MELCALGMLTGPESPFPFMRHSARVEVAETAAGIRTAGAAALRARGPISGQSGNPTPVDGLQMFVAALMAHGVSAAEIQTMGREVPGGLLMG